HGGGRLRNGARPGASGGVGRVYGPVCRVGDQSNDRDVADRGLRFVEQPVRSSSRDLAPGQRLRLAKQPWFEGVPACAGACRQTSVPQGKVVSLTEQSGVFGARPARRKDSTVD